MTASEAPHRDDLAGLFRGRHKMAKSGFVARTGSNRRIAGFVGIPGITGIWVLRNLRKTSTGRLVRTKFVRSAVGTKSVQTYYEIFVVQPRANPVGFVSTKFVGSGVGVCRKFADPRPPMVDGSELSHPEMPSNFRTSHSAE